ncbi:MAG: hypothetical protein BM559_08490 [Roseobacter sp. MedPE-SWchi]|nr:MAG: hypothetical protein BM559_08490 [Roseobacter sp. MedPE-SWchi]
MLCLSIAAWRRYWDRAIARQRILVAGLAKWKNPPFEKAGFTGFGALERAGLALFGQVAI